MRVLLSDTWAAGGGSTFVALMARALTDRGHEVDVVLGYRDAPAVDAYRHVVRRIFSPPTSFTALVLRGGYDVVHGTDADLHPPFDYARRVKRLGLGAAMVTTSHSAQGPHLPAGSDALVFVSERSAATQQFAPQRTLVIPNGVDADRLRAAANPALVQDVIRPMAVWVGRIEEAVPQKDFMGFGYAIRGLLDQGWEVLIIDGASPDNRYPASAQIQRWFGSSVRYASQVPPELVLGALQRAGQVGGALVSTSRVEGAPFIALEALAVGCPVVAPEIGGYHRLRQLGLVTTYTGVDGLLASLREGTHLAPASTLPPELHLDQMIEQYLRLYEEVRPLSDNSARARFLRLAATAATRRVRVGR